jgi:hypothetical protein
MKRISIIIIDYFKILLKHQIRQINRGNKSFTFHLYKINATIGTKVLYLFCFWYSVVIEYRIHTHPHPHPMLFALELLTELNSDGIKI